jgi:Putative DNA-binding domain
MPRTNVQLRRESVWKRDLESRPISSTRTRRQTPGQLRELQRLALGIIRNPLSRAGNTQSRWHDGRPMSQVIAGFVKPNDRLTSLERLEIYNKQYWYRLLDCLWDDYPGLRAILGDKKFQSLRIAYLQRYPSRSFTLRNLGSRLVEFLQEQPRYAAPHQAMCLDMARFEWAQVVAFDEAANPPLTVDELLGKAPGKLRMALQPHLTLLEMGYPLDDFVIAIKKRDTALRSEASNAVDADRKQSRPRRSRVPKPAKVFLAVHRYNNSLYYKRLAPEAFRILAALRDGATLAQACAAVAPKKDPGGAFASQIQTWFAQWMEMGWFCRRPGRRG